MIEKIRNIFAIPELRRKIIFTLGILVIVRLGSQVPIPGIGTWEPSLTITKIPKVNKIFLLNSGIAKIFLIFSITE